MSKSKRKMLISSLLVELNDETIPDQKRKQLSNNLAASMLAITRNIHCAKTILNSEKRKIETRGNERENYLFGVEHNLEDIISYYYNHAVLDNTGNYRLSKDLLLVELLLLFSVFEGLYGKYKQNAKEEMDTILKLKKQTRKKHRRVASNSDDMRSKEQLLNEARESFADIAVVKEHIKSICSSISMGILAAMGISVDEMSNPDIEKYINLESTYRDTVNSFSVAKHQLAKFCNTTDSHGIAGIELLQKCGDESNPLQNLADKIVNKQKVKS